MDFKEKKPIYNIDAEEAVLASLMLDGEAVVRIAATLSRNDFYREKHQWVYEALLALSERKEGIDLVTVADELDRRGKLDGVGGYMGVSELQLRLPTAVHVEHYAKIVANYSIRRKLIGAAEAIAKMAVEHEYELPETVERAEQLIFAISANRVTGAMKPLKEFLGEFHKQVEDLYAQNSSIGLPTSFRELDRLLGGLHPGDLVILAGRPGMGKTSLALSIAESAALKHQAKIGIFSLEMGGVQLSQRLVSARTSIEMKRLRVGPLYSDDMERIKPAVEILGKAKIFVDESPSLTALETRTKARRIASEHGLDLIVIDYLQLMGSGQRIQNATQEVTVITRMMKELARELEVPVLLLSQLNRGVESRQDKRPMLADLRTSGSIEQDADVVMFVYRDEVYNKETDKPNIAEIIVAKHRNGPTGTVELRFDKSSARFYDLDEVELSEEELHAVEYMMADIVF